MLRTKRSIHWGLLDAILKYKSSHRGKKEDSDNNSRIKGAVMAMEAERKTAGTPPYSVPRGYTTHANVNK